MPETSPSPDNKSIDEQSSQREEVSTQKIQRKSEPTEAEDVIDLNGFEELLRRRKFRSIQEALNEIEAYETRLSTITTLLVKLFEFCNGGPLKQEIQITVPEKINDILEILIPADGNAEKIIVKKESSARMEVNEAVAKLLRSASSSPVSSSVDKNPLNARDRITIKTILFESTQKILMQIRETLEEPDGDQDL